MPSATRYRILPINQLATEWETFGRSAAAVRALELLAERDNDLSALVHGTGGTTLPSCPTPCDLIDHMWHATGRRDREAAAALIRLMLREAEPNSLINRILLQALLPGMISVAAKLRWGQGGDWEDANEFFSELLSTTWVVLSEWSGQDRPYAVLDLLSAVRCRLRRQLLRSSGHEQQRARLTPVAVSTKNSSGETQLEQLARALIDLRQEGMRAEDVEVLYAHHVLGFSISELAVMTGRDRRALYARRDRGYRRISA